MTVNPFPVPVYSLICPVSLVSHVRPTGWTGESDMATVHHPANTIHWPPMLDQCLASVVDAVPTLIQHWGLLSRADWDTCAGGVNTPLQSEKALSA